MAACSGGRGDTRTGSGGGTAGRQPSHRQPAGRQPSHRQAAGRQPSHRQPSGRQPTGRQPTGRQPAGRQPPGRQPPGRQPAGRQPSGRQPPGRQPPGRQPSRRQPAGKQPASRQPPGRQPAGRQPAGRQPSGRQPSSDNHPGDTGHGIMSWLNFLNKDKAFTFPHIRIVYPSAPERPFTALEGEVLSVWFDRKLIEPHVSEDATVDHAADLIHELVEQEVKNGIPRNRIILGGFSMGGALSLYYGLQRDSNLAGLFALSSFLNDNSKVYKTLQSRPQKLPPVLQVHGGRDVFVHHDWGKATYQKLQNLGVDITFHTIPDMPHELRPQVLEILRQWAMKQIPQET